MSNSPRTPGRNDFGDREGFHSRDCVDVVVDLVGNSDPRPISPQLLAQLQLKREQLARWVEEWKQQPGHEGKEPDFASLEGVIDVECVNGKTSRVRKQQPGHDRAPEDGAPRNGTP